MSTCVISVFSSVLPTNRKMKCIWIWFWTTFLRRSTEWPDTTAEPNRLCPWFMSRYRSLCVCLSVCALCFACVLVSWHLTKDWRFGGAAQKMFNFFQNLGHQWSDTQSYPFWHQIRWYIMINTNISVSLSGEITFSLTLLPWYQHHP